MSGRDRPLVWLHGKIKTPPMSSVARIEAGVLLRRLQNGERIALPHSRPMPGVGARCNELRINDETKSWRIMYRIDPDAIVILAVFEKKTQATPIIVIAACKQRLKVYDELGQKRRHP